MITDPFTDEQVNWTLEELGTVWMRNDRERREQGDYVWKVLLPECLTRFYMDFCGVGRSEAEQRMAETPLHRRDEVSL